MLSLKAEPAHIIYINLCCITYYMLKWVFLISNLYLSGMLDAGEQILKTCFEVRTQRFLILCARWLLEVHSLCVDWFCMHSLSRLPQPSSSCKVRLGEQAGHKGQLNIWSPKMLHRTVTELLALCWTFFSGNLIFLLLIA